MGQLTKSDCIDQLISICDMDEHEQIFRYLADYLTGDQMREFVEHIKDEKGL